MAQRRRDHATYVLRQPTTLDRDEAWFAEVSAHRDTIVFTVYERASWRAVGTAYLTDIDQRQRRAEFGILVGEAARRGREYGTEAVRLVLEFALIALGLHSVMLACYEYNLAGRRAYEKAGFREFGRRQSHWMGGRWWDEVYMDCLATEFASPVLGQVLVPDAPHP